MIGITLSSDQIRTAPPEVRHWIERQVAVSLGLQVATHPDGQGTIDELAVCSVEELSGILTMIQGVFPAVNVLFELGRPGASVAQGRLQAYRLIDILHHGRLQSIEQVVSCLDFINEAMCRVRGRTDATFYGLADNGNCFVAVQTQQNIARLWRNVVGSQQISPVANPPTAPAASTAGAFQTPFRSAEDSPMPNSSSGNGT